MIIGTGPVGSQTAKAARLYTERKNVPGGTGGIIHMPLKEIVPKTASKVVDLAVVPYNNLLEGLVRPLQASSLLSLDLIYASGLRIVGSQRLPLEWVLLAHPEHPASDTVYSHPMALLQCSLWLKNEGLKQEETESTAEAVGVVEKFEEGYAIATEDSAKGLEVIARGIGNQLGGIQNYTDFLAVSGNGYKEPYFDGKDYRTMVVLDPGFDDTGLLWSILGVVKDHGINNTDIHSVPPRARITAGDSSRTPLRKNGNPPKMFYLEMACHQEEGRFLRCERELRKMLGSHNTSDEALVVMGSYEAPSFNEGN